ncbi:MAG TPA: iron-sulfur cluster repair di-iron protein [Bryobacteraceae bacterium]|nr:iron-sulfur cluster repair di-iron protein [Bryobacteraceae bacterium]
MSTLHRELTVGEIAAQSPASIRVFERYGIDFCCGGNVPLSEASKAKGLSWETILREIDSAAAQPAPTGQDWQNASLSELVEHLVSTHHVYLKTQLPRLSATLDKVLSRHAANHGAVLQPLAVTFFAMREELEAHLMKEEMILFPLIRQMEEAKQAGARFGGSHCGSVENPIRVMVMEHDSAGEGLAKMRALTSDFTPPEDACNTFRGLYFEMAALEADLHQHIHLENNILFPRAVELEAR